MALRSDSFKKFIYILILFALPVIGVFGLVSIRQKNLKLCTAEDGTTAVLMDDGSKDLIRIYTTDGDPKVEVGTTTANDGFGIPVRTLQQW